MGVAKVIINDVTEIDLTADTVTADTLAEGKTAHDAKGEIITGTMTSGGGGGTVTGSDILRFVDIDGNVVSTSSPSTITALPSQPSVDGLDSMGWSLTLDECKAKTGTVTVSPVYKPSDNKTHIVIRAIANQRMSLGQWFVLYGSTMTIEWGDGTSDIYSDGSCYTYGTNTWYGFLLGHTYNTGGEYTILVSSDGDYALGEAYGNNGIDASIIAAYAYACRVNRLCVAGVYSCARYTAYDVNYTLYGSRSDPITSIGSSAFRSCYALALTSLPEGITSIGSYAFESCYALALTSLPEGITSIGSYAFGYCYALALTSLPEGITSIGSSAFESCYALALTSLPEGITSIGGSAFRSCYALALTSLPEGITSIGGSAFGYCYALALTSLPEGITSIGDYAFESCYALALTSLPEGITSISDSAFRSCYALALTSLPEGITSIGSSAFRSCYALALTSLPEGITSIGSYAFGYCAGLTTLTFKGTPTSIASNAFISCTNLKDIYVPWSEGAVANAPWGATNATIHYDSEV